MYIIVSGWPLTPYLRPNANNPIQYLLAWLFKLKHHPELSNLSRYERVSICASVWPQFFIFHFSQTESGSSVKCLKLRQLIGELRAIKLDPTEFLLLEALIVGGSHEVDHDDNPKGKHELAVQHKIRISSHITLAKYHLVVRPKHPERLPEILLLMRALKAAVTVDVIAKEFFSGDSTLVLLFVNNILLNDK